MKKNNIYSLIIAISFLVIVVSRVEAAKEVKVGFVDTKYIIENYRTASDAQRAFDTEIAKYKHNADSLKTIYDQAMSEFESQKLMLSEQGKAAKLIEINQLKKQYDDYTTEVWGTGGKMEQKNRELITPIVQKIQAAVQTIALKEGFSLVLDASDAKIVYAQTDLDITNEVLDELNKEYAATIIPPTAPEKDINIAVFPIYEENQDAQQGHIGESMRSAISDLIKSVPKIHMISSGDVNNALLTRSISLTSQISDADAYSIGRTIQADYLIIGKISQQGKKIDFTLRLCDPLNSLVMYEGSGTASRVEELKQAVGNLVQQASKKIKPQTSEQIKNVKQ
jgi:outer membrane protein